MYQKDESQCLMEVQVVRFTREGALARERPGSAGKGKGTRPISEGAEAVAGLHDAEVLARLERRSRSATFM